MTAAQPKLIDDAGDQVIKAKGLEISYRYDGLSIIGEISLDRPNPFNRRKCRIDFHLRAAWWTDDAGIGERILGVAAHWFRDIGGLRIVQQRQAFQIAKLLLTDGGPTEAQLHDAIAAYAANPMCRKARSWKALDNWLRSGDWQRWLDYAEADKRDARLAAQKEAELAEAARGRAQAARERKQATQAARTAQKRDLADEAQQQAAKEARARTRAEQAQLDGFYAHPPDVQQAALERVSKDLRRPIPPDLAADPEFRSLAITRAQIIAHRRLEAAPPADPASPGGQPPQTPSGDVGASDAMADGRCSGLASSPQPSEPP